MILMTSATSAASAIVRCEEPRSAAAFEPLTTDVVVAEFRALARIVGAFWTERGRFAGGLTVAVAEPSRTIGGL